MHIISKSLQSRFAYRKEANSRSDLADFAKQTVPVLQKHLQAAEAADLEEVINQTSWRLPRDNQVTRKRGRNGERPGFRPDLSPSPIRRHQYG